MIISRRGCWAATHLLIFLFGGGADAAAAPRLEGRQVQSQPASATPTGSAASSSATGYFQTQWNGLQDSYSLNDEINAQYTVTVDNSTVSTAGSLNLMLLWTSATSGTPDSTNTFAVIKPSYTCDGLPNPNTCSYQAGKSGRIDHLRLVVGPNQYPPPSSDGVVDNFFFCLANGQYCESFSKFFSLNIGSKNARQLQVRQSPLTTPSAILPVPNPKPFLVFPGSLSSSSTTPTASFSSSASTTAVTTTSTGPTSSFVTVSMTPTGTTTVSTNTETASSSSSKSSHKGLPTGAIIGIAIGGFLILLIAALLIFFCYRRRRRQQQITTPEQVMLTHNMNTSRDLMAEKHNSDAATMLTGSIIDTCPTSDYDHISTSAPYHGRVGPNTHLPAHTPPPMSALPPTPITLPQRNPTAATARTNLSRNVSDASGPIIPRSLMEGESQYDAYHNHQDHDDPSPVYGDARHVAQVYQAPTQVQAPFLSEPGMTDEELTRLEDEERQIDAAILEAERRIHR